MTPHRCRPAERVVAFFHTCAVCGSEIEPVTCPRCNGDGGEAFPYDDCLACKGTGVRRWRPACGGVESGKTK